MKTEEVEKSVIGFAQRIATALLESQSSTAIFFVQQAYPDDIDGLDQDGFEGLLKSVKANAEFLLKEFYQ